MKLTWLGHACFLVETKEGSLVLDPYAPGSVPGLTLPPLEVDAVFCTHGHRDHAYAEGVRLTGNTPAFRLRKVPSFHDNSMGMLRGKNLIAVLEAEGKRLVHLGDLGHPLKEEQLAVIGTPDVLLIPVGGHYTIDAATAAEIVRTLQPKLTIPMHYRGEGFGYKVIGPVDGFAAQFEDVQQWDSNVIDPEEAQSPVVILKCPAK